MAGTAGSAFEYDAEMADAQTPDLRSWQALNAPVQQHENKRTRGVRDQKGRPSF
jgi:hypothetical protein